MRTKTRSKARKTRGARPRARAAKTWGELTARDLMRTDVASVEDSAPLSEVERVLAENRVSDVPVVDEAGAILGIVSLRDVVERYSEDPDARPPRRPGFFDVSVEETFEEDFEGFQVPEESEETAADVMSSEVYAVPADADLAEIAKTMAKHRIHRVLVREDGRYVGIVGTLDILGALGGKEAR